MPDWRTDGVRARGKPIPPDARAAILAWQRSDALTLNDLARSLSVILSSARTLRSRNSKQQGKIGRRNESRRPDECGVKVLHSPGDQFGVGAKFTITDLECMVEFSGMPDGTMFEVTKRDGSVYRCKMKSGELVRITQ